MDVSDCIEGILIGLLKGKKKINIFNIGLDYTITVKQSVKRILKYLKFNPKIKFKGGKRGWIGDSPKILLDAKKLRSLGWKPKFSIYESIDRTLEDLIYREKK